MTDPLTDHRRPAEPARHPGEPEPSGQWIDVVGSVRTVLAFLLGTAAALFLAAALVLAVGAVQVLSPERPARVVPVLLSASEVRLDVARDWTAELESDLGVRFTEGERAEMVAALDDVLASPEVHRQLRDLRPVDARLEGSGIAVALADGLRARAAGRSPAVAQALREAADELPRVLEAEGSSADATELMRGLSQVRRVALVAAAVVAVPGLVAGAIALGVARRRPLTAVLVSSGALLVAVLTLAPGRFVLERLPGALSLPGHVLAAIGELSGPGTMWTLVLAVGLPPGAWWALRSLRGSRAGAVPTT